MNSIRDEINRRITLDDAINRKEVLDDITVDLARSCYNYSLFKLQEQRVQYKKELIEKITFISLHGGQHVVTRDTKYEEITEEYLEELKEFFKERGFECEILNENSCSCLKISWKDKKEK